MRASVHRTHATCVRVYICASPSGLFQDSFPGFYKLTSSELRDVRLPSSQPLSCLRWKPHATIKLQHAIAAHHAGCFANVPILSKWVRLLKHLAHSFLAHQGKGCAARGHAVHMPWHMLKNQAVLPKIKEAASIGIIVILQVLLHLCRTVLCLLCMNLPPF
jgi:hypothetical protein